MGFDHFDLWARYPLTHLDEEAKHRQSELLLLHARTSHFDLSPTGYRSKTELINVLVYRSVQLDHTLLSLLVKYRHYACSRYFLLYRSGRLRW